MTCYHLSSNYLCSITLILVDPLGICFVGNKLYTETNSVKQLYNLLCSINLVNNCNSSVIKELIGIRDSAHVSDLEAADVAELLDSLCVSFNVV